MHKFSPALIPGESWWQLAAVVGGMFQSTPGINTERIIGAWWRVD